MILISDIKFWRDLYGFKVGIVGKRGLSTVLGFHSIPGVTVEAFSDLNEALLAEKAA